MTLSGNDENKIERAKTRVLLVLWGLGGIGNVVGKGKIQPLTRGKEKSADYDEIFAALEEGGAIALTKQKNGKIKGVTLTQVGCGLLAEMLRSFEFEGTQIGARMGNYLVKWIANYPAAPVVESAPKISSYDEFKVVAIAAFDRLNRAYNLNDFVAIYRIRREIGHSVDRLEFNDWMLRMQEENIFHLRTGGLEATDDQKQDSINDEYRGLLFVATKF